MEKSGASLTFRAAGVSSPNLAHILAGRQPRSCYPNSAGVSRRFVGFQGSNRKFIAQWSCAAHKTFNIIRPSDKFRTNVLFSAHLCAVPQPHDPFAVAIPVAEPALTGYEGRLCSLINGSPERTRSR